MDKTPQVGNSDTSSTNRQNVSFKFTKTTSKMLTGNSLAEKSSESVDYVTSVDEAKINSSIKKADSKELVIPLIKKNNWRTSKTSQNNATDEESTIKDLAVQELLKEASKKNAEWERREAKDMIDSIPLIMQNKVPEGFETDDKLDLSLRPEESTLDEYEQVPIEQFGLAMLKGMGWSESAPIGDRNKQCVKPIEVQLRPKGLGLGADASALKKSQKKAKEEKLELVKDAYVHITQGPHKGYYGQVLSLDVENARAIIKLSSEEKIKTFPEFFFNLVSKKEFDKESRIINRKSYEHYKREKELKEKEELNGQSSDGDDKQEREDYSRDSREKRKNYDSYERESKKSKKHSKRRKHSRERSEEKQSSSRSRHVRIWVRPQLRVRFIDDKYKKGKYFNKKLIVVDVLSQNSCSCKTEDDRTFLDDISPAMLETVIPRDESAYVMIVQGKHSGELCTILKKDKSQCVATVQFLSDRNQALKIEYDSICEYVGDVTQFD